MIFNLILNHSGSSAPSSYTPPTWAGGTDAEIVEALEKHYNGEVDLTQYWSVGDERTISLSAMSATGVGESHAAQDVTFVILNVGGKTLATSVNGHTSCAFIVGQKYTLDETGYMYSSNSSSIGWNGCKRRTWCNEVYYASIPSTIRSIFKQHINVTGTSYSTGTTSSTDYFALASEKELFGSTSYANATSESSLSQFKYYETSANRNKYDDYWTRSRRGSSSYRQFVYYRDSSGSSYYSNMSNALGIAPFGVI